MLPRIDTTSLPAERTSHLLTPPGISSANASRRYTMLHVCTYSCIIFGTDLPREYVRKISDARGTTERNPGAYSKRWPGSRHRLSSRVSDLRGHHSPRSARSGSSGTMHPRLRRRPRHVFSFRLRSATKEGGRRPKARSWEKDGFDRATGSTPVYRRRLDQSGSRSFPPRRYWSDGSHP